MESHEGSFVTPSPSPDAISGDDLSDSLNLPSSFINAENYITIKEGCQSAFTVDELLEAVSRCKKLVLESEQCSEERKWFVRRLIELRHRLEQAKENQNASQHNSEVEESLVRLGHNLKIQPPPVPATRKVYCDHCCGAIWNVLQAFYRCIDCRFKCHEKCAQALRRVCPVLALSETRYESRICPEEGLDKQGYQCFECQRRISFTISKGYLGNPFSSTNSMLEARRCDYSGKYYCHNCHWGTLSVIPARIMHNWDFDPYPISRASYQLIKMSRRHPILTLDSKLFMVLDDLNTIKRMREEMILMKHYIATCRLSQESGFLKELDWGRNLIHNTEWFSLEDLIEIKEGTLISRLTEIHDRLTSHIKNTCEVCRGRGFLCLVCQDKRSLFPFDSNVYVCPKCENVQHKHCWLAKKICVKCVRKMKTSSDDDDTI